MSSSDKWVIGFGPEGRCHAFQICGGMDLYNFGITKMNFSSLSFDVLLSSNSQVQFGP